MHEDPQKQRTTTHLPGPWSWVGGYEVPTRHGTSRWQAVSTTSGVEVCQVHYDEERQRAIATATLIAAAPELLEALETTLGNLKSLKHNAFRHFDTLDEWLIVVEKAVKAARGER